jgi:pyochelin biosynthetic protein PchC
LDIRVSFRRVPAWSRPIVRRPGGVLNVLQPAPKHPGTPLFPRHHVRSIADMAAPVRSSWFRRFRPVPDPRVRLVCFPHAGGSASAYRAWPALLPADVEVLAVQYPGRQDRRDEAYPADVHELADAVTDALAPFLDRPLALFGHSMGASAAHEVALRLRNPLVAGLFVSARLPPRHHRPRDQHADEDALLADVRALDPAGSAVLDDPDLRELLVPAIRADYRIADTYLPSAHPVVDVPVVAYVGDRDPCVSRWQMRAWAEITNAGFDVVVFPGDHFYLKTCADRLTGDIGGRLGTRLAWSTSGN